MTQAVGAHAVEVPARDWGHDLAAMRAAITARTRLSIANPNNPTGTWLRSDELQVFLDNVPESVLVVVDEAYLNMSGRAITRTRSRGWRATRISSVRVPSPRSTV